ncbi:uncharacterized protein LOC125043644 [Penaeus chinensis]|uniref:uncharacterized protein LOC125043644 n=1 Tax=Penaeus chinensis TaxID=139456 RepID=UPI001FB809AE|nr:uncharacterized protein LOC125043644 [Penaeus chinensis]
MSSESETDEFFDAFDTTPQRQSARAEEGSAAEVPPKSPKEQQWKGLEHTSSIGSMTIGQELLQSVEKKINQSSSTSTLMQPPSQPFLHPLKAFQSSKDLRSGEQAKIEISPGGLEKEERISLSGLSAGKRDVEESSSACSGSLLGNLGDDDDDEAAPRVRSGGRRRTRHREVRKQMQTEDDDPPFLPSPAGSQSSSLEGIYPQGRTSHPFRVVEHDTASVYSSVSLGKVGKIPSGPDGHTIRECHVGPEIEALSEDKVLEQPLADPPKDVLLPGNMISPACEGRVNQQTRRQRVSQLYFPHCLLPHQQSREHGLLIHHKEPDLVASTKSSSGSDKSNSLPRAVQETPPAGTLGEPAPSPLHLPHAEPPREEQAPELPSSPAVIPAQPCQNGEQIQVVDPCAATQAVSLAPIVPQEVPQVMCPPPAPPSAVAPPVPAPAASTVPVAPPRRRRRNRLNTDDDTASLASVSSLPSPALTLTTVDAISIGQSLDLRQAVRGDYLVKPQDSENAKAVGPSAEEIARIEAEDTTSQASTPEVSRAPSRLANTGQQPTSSEGTPDTPGTPGSLPSDTPTSDAAASPASSSDGQKKQLNLMVRTRSDSGKELSDAEWFLQSPVDFDAFMSDKEILKQVTVLNLDTGERIPLSDAESCLPPALNPLSLHIMRLTSEYVSNSNVDGQESDEESVTDVIAKKLPEIDSSAVKKKTFPLLPQVSPTPSQESLVSQHSGQSGEDLGSLDPNDDGSAPFMPKPFCVYTGHTADMLDISWSKNYFLLTSSMDKTVRLWHISRKECLCIFQHMDFVTAITFHPKDDRYFISGALDGKLRLWSIPDKRVVLWNEVGGQPNLITAANFCQNGKFTVVGTYDGRCIFYETEQLKYFTQINVRSTRGKNAKGRKITGIEPLPGEDKVLITSNDSRIRLYDLRDLNLSCKYKGYSNMSSQIRAGFSHDGKFIVAGSENQCIYIWKTHHDYSKFSSARRDRNLYWEGVKAHSAVVTCAVFAPHPELVFSFIEQQQEILSKSGEQEQQHPQQQQPHQTSQNKDSGTTNKGYVLVSADFNGCIKVFLKKEKPKHSSLPASALV